MTTFIPGGPARYAHQRKGLRKILATNGVAALLFEPGTGKTATALDFASVLAIKHGWRRCSSSRRWPLSTPGWTRRRRGSARRSRSPPRRWVAPSPSGARPWPLVVAGRSRRPSPAKDTPLAIAHRGRSLAYAERLEPGLPLVEIVSVNTDMLASAAPRSARLTVADKVLDAVKRYDPDLVIVDESHRIKGNNGNASRLLHRIGRNVEYRLILTGTVMPHSPLDVYAQWRFLDPYAFGSDGQECHLVPTSTTSSPCSVAGWARR